MKKLIVILMTIFLGVAFTGTTQANGCINLPSYEGSTGILSIPLVNVGELGQFQNVQVTIDEVLDATPVGSGFISNGDGTISQTEYGLMWQRTGSDPNMLTWEQGRDYCETLSDAGYTDWHLPTMNELKGLVYCSNGRETPLDDYEDCGTGYSSPTINSLFAVQGSGYWTSRVDGSAAWFVRFSDGNTYTLTSVYGAYVRCVRTETSSE
jgi:hypothetical protein